MSRTFQISAMALAVAALGLSACGGGGADQGQGGGGGSGLEIELRALNGSGQSGTATLAQTENGVNILVDTVLPPALPSQPVHIHKGTCDNLDPNPAFPLPNMEDGLAADTIDTTIEELKSGYSINVHKSEKEADVYVACGEIK